MKQRTALVRPWLQPRCTSNGRALGSIDYNEAKLIIELEDIWLEDRTTVVMVTHDVDEAVYLSDRVIVMSTDKGRIIEDLHIDLDRPRDRKSERYEEYKNRLTDVLSKVNLVTGE